jgi:hypothetical protein
LTPRAIRTNTEHRSPTPEDNFRIEVWTAAQSDGGVLLETISRSGDFQISNAAHADVSVRRPGKFIVHLNQRHVMSAVYAPLRAPPPTPPTEPPAAKMMVLGDVKEWEVLGVHSHGCGHKANLDKQALLRRYGKDYDVLQLEPRLRCKRCGSRAQSRLTLGRMAPVVSDFRIGY